MVQVLPVSGDDEQRIVDAHTQADHQAEERSELGHLDEVGEDRDGHRAGHDAGDGHADGQTHGQHGPEGHHEDHDGERDAEGFRGGLLELAEALATDRHLEAGLLRDDVLEDVADLAGLIPVLPRHLDGREGDGAVLVDLLPASRRVGADDRQAVEQVEVRVGQVGPLGLREPREPRIGGDVDRAWFRQRLDAGEHGLEGGPHRGVVHALVGLHHDRALHAATDAAEVLVEGVEAVGALEAGQGEVLAEVAPGGAADAADDEHGAHPEEDNGLAALEAPGTKTSKHELPPRGRGFRGEGRPPTASRTLYVLVAAPPSTTVPICPVRRRPGPGIIGRAMLPA